VSFSRQFSVVQICRIILAPLLVALLVTSCRSTAPTESTALTKAEKEALTSRAKPPQTFGIAVQSTRDGVTFAGAFRQHRNHIGNLDFREGQSGYRPVIEINDGKAALLLDTAAAESWLTVDAATQLGMMPLIGPGLFERTPRHVVDDTGGFAAVVRTVRFEQAHVENALFYVRNARGPLDALARDEDKAELDGVLGADALRAFEFVRISMKSGKMVVSGSSVYPYAENALAIIPLINVRGGLGVEALVDGDRVRAVLDLAGAFEMASPQPAIPLIRQVTLGDVVFRQVEVVDTISAGLGADSPPRIGRKLLERYDLVINQRGKQLILERPTQ